MPITLTNLSLVYSIYLPLAIASLICWLLFLAVRRRMKRNHLALTLALTLPAVVGMLSFVLGYKAPVSVGISAIVPYWHSIWLFVSFPASIILGVIFAVFAYDGYDSYKPDSKN